MPLRQRFSSSSYRQILLFICVWEMTTLNPVTTIYLAHCSNLQRKNFWRKKVPNTESSSLRHQVSKNLLIKWKIKHIPRTIGALSVHFLPQLTADLHWMEQSSFFLITLHPINLNVSCSSAGISTLSLARPAKKWDGASSGLISGRHFTDFADCNGIQDKD